ncbi:M48 family metallopeptidase [Thermococcus sp. Bubb.Bath]|uniref:M48 family metallopeptidase n=1 Tax=Thermococcus sp. Bubb.Bath TaxID=1638242 RepID=UPI00143CA15C|nr:M48 family metalloprotease [Thermococcus sp. Bubb.Bath]NJF24800.1 zinc metallopeptidase [Thermococcus sp. Bubb.Bath]
MLLLPIALLFGLAYAVAGQWGLELGLVTMGAVLFIGLLGLPRPDRRYIPLEETSSGEILEGVRALAERAGIEKFRVYILDDYIPNAYSFGRNIVLSLGLFEILDEEEILAVAAHELGHIKNKDTIFFPIVTYLRVFSFVMFILLTILSRSFWVSILAFMFYVYYEFERSRFLKNREFKADDLAVRILNVPLSLKRALEELKYYEDLREGVKNETLPGIEPSIERPEKKNSKQIWHQNVLLFPTHPSYEERIFRIVTSVEDMVHSSRR